MPISARRTDSLDSAIGKVFFVIFSLVGICFSFASSKQFWWIFQNGYFAVFEKASWEKNSFHSDQDPINENNENGEEFKLFQIQTPHTCNLTCPVATDAAFPRVLAILS